jgi:hypothetical protein
MLNRHRAVPGFALAAALLLGACTEIPTHPVDDDGSDRGREAPQASVYSASRADYYQQLTDAVPGYGGHYFDETGELVLWLKDSPMTEVEAISALSGRMDVLGLGGDFSIQRTRVAPAQWTFEQLNEMRSRVDVVLGLKGSIYTDADEAINRVTIAVENSSDIDHISQAVAMAGVPAAAVNYKVMDPIIPMQTLNDRVRPVAGGLQINFPGFVCTLGAPIREANGTLGWITNSHCTDSQWNMTGTHYGQPSNTLPGNPNYIGQEVADPPGFVGGVCPAGRTCRYSDASKGHFSGGQIALPGEVALGRIYRTTAVNVGTAVAGRTIDAVNPFFNIVAERPFSNVGQTIHKVGRTTGWSNGTVTHSCVNVGVSGTTLAVLCQDIVQRPGVSIVAGGDSGSSVWDMAPGGGPNDVRIHGLLWGGSGASLFVFSAMNEIRYDHGWPTWTTF